MNGHAGAVPLTAETFAEVMPREMFAEVTFQRCDDQRCVGGGCGQPTMTVHGDRAEWVFHLTDAELSAVERGAGRVLAGLDD